MDVEQSDIVTELRVFNFGEVRRGFHLIAAKVEEAEEKSIFGIGGKLKIGVPFGRGCKITEEKRKLVLCGGVVEKAFHIPFNLSLISRESKSPLLAGALA